MHGVITGESTWAVAEGDCLSLLRELPEASVDLVATDPPYGISFMGREWNRATSLIHSTRILPLRARTRATTRRRDEQWPTPRSPDTKSRFVPPPPPCSLVRF